jgi:RNA polymerase sigma-70 factor (ECF subfamily)
VAGADCIPANEVMAIPAHSGLLMTVAVERSEWASDLELAKASAAGDLEAFEEIYRQHHRRVYSLCLRMLGNPAQAEEMTQEVFLQVYRKIGDFRGDSALSTWLHRITINQVLMQLRRRGVKLEQVEEEANSASGSLNIVDRLALEEAISELPPGYRTIFILHDVEGYEHNEISDMLNISIGTSKSQLHKARMRLRELLSKGNVEG